MGAGFVADTGDFNFLFEQFNRNKRGVSIDLRSEAGRAAFDKLLEWADVFITNFLPSARTKLRLDPDDVWAVNPRLVYARGHGQGQRGPDADLGGFDSVSYWSRGGIGHMLTPPGGPFIMQRGAMGDAPSGAFLAGGIGTALFQRERTGKGVLVDVALLGAAVWTLAVDLVPTSILQHDPDKFGATVLSSPLVGPYATADGRWLVLNMLDAERHWAPACRALGLTHLIDDPQYATTAGARREPRRTPRAVRRGIGKQTLADLRAALSAEDTVFSALAAPTEVHRRTIRSSRTATCPRTRTTSGPDSASGPVQFDMETTTVRRGAPKVGEHTDEVFAELGFSAAEIEALRAAAARSCSPVHASTWLGGCALNG